MPVERVRTLGVPIDVIPSLAWVEEAARGALDRAQPWLMTFANPASAVMTRRHPELTSLFERFHLVAPDGIGMVHAVRLLHRQKVARISFDSTSLAPWVFRFARDAGLPVALIGGRPGIAQRAAGTIEKSYPGIQIIGTADGYSDHRTTISVIQEMCPSVVIVGMGTLRQERFLINLTEAGWCGIGFTCGGYLDQLVNAGMNYYPQWVDRANLRWLYRLAREPRRLWHRYLVDYPSFAVGLCLCLLASSRDEKLLAPSQIDKSI